MGGTGRVAALDGLRGVAILLVVADHLHVPGVGHGGPVGVAVFFVLSGYLITGILLRRPSAADFYRRRAARLLPALLFMLAVVTVPALMLTGQWRYARDAGIVLGYVSNFAQIHGMSMSSLSPMWSLAVEEQFYLLWPLVIWRTPRTRLVPVLAGLIAVSLALRFTVSPVHAYVGTDTNVYALALGALLAVTRARITAPAVAVAAGVGVLLVACWPGQDGRWIAVAAAAFGVAMIAARPPWLGGRVLAYFGGVSYAWYLWHVPVSAFLSAFLTGPPRYLLAGAVSLAAAEASTRWLERPILERARARRMAAV